MRVGVVGIGYWGANLVRNFYELGVLTAVCDISHERLDYVKSHYPGVKTFSTIQDILPHIDACAIATSGATHYQIAKQLLEAGKDIYVEKPLARSAQSCKELIDLAERNKRILMVGHLLLYHPAVRKLKEYIDSGTLGDIRYIYTQRLNLGRIREDEDALWTLGPHDISMIIYLLNDRPHTLAATGESYLMPGLYDVVFITLYFPKKVVANIHLSWLDPHKVRKLTIVGTKKMVTFDDMANEKLTIYDKGVEPVGESFALRIGDIYIPSIEPCEPLRIECMHFIDCVRTRQTPLTDGVNGLTIVEILEQVQTALSSGNRVKLY